MAETPVPPSTPTGPETPAPPDAPWWRGTRGEWYVVVQFVLFALIAFAPRSNPLLPPWPEPVATVATYAGLLFMLDGATLALWGLYALGSRNLTALPYPRVDGQLVQTGPYRFVRNPIYSGLVLGAFGWSLWLHSYNALAYTVALFVLFDLKLRREEAWLCERYPDYAEYQKRVKKLIPFVW